VTVRRRRTGSALAAAWLAVAALAVLLGLGTAAPASAHATLVKTDPAEGAILPTAPDQVRLTFNEAVTAVPDGVQVFDDQGGVVPASARASGEVLTIELEEEVGDGSFVVAWRIVSADSHPVSGSLSFSVGAPSAEVAPLPAAVDVETAATAPGPPRALTVARWAGYAGLLLTVGLVAFAVLFLPVGPDTDRARLRLVTAARAGAGVAVVAWLLALPLSAVYQLGGDIGSLTSGATWSALATMEYVVTAAVLGGVLGAVWLLGRGSPGRRRGVAALVAGTIAACAPAFTGHTRATTPEALAVGVDMLHLVVVSVWLGGLVALALVLPGLAARGTVGAEVLARFSGVAAALLAMLVVTGALLAWRIVGTWSALVESGYGQLLLAKILTATVAVAIAAWNRYSLLPVLQRAVRRRERRAGARPIARAVGAEAAVLAAVLLFTGFLVDKSPEAEASVAGAAAPPAEVEGGLGDVTVLATVESPNTGPSTVTVTMEDAAGEPFEGYEAPRLQLSSDDVDLGDLPVESIEPGSYAGEAVFPAAGTWELQVSLRVSEFDNPVTTLEFEVAGG
jgi:copper transport protein